MSFVVLRRLGRVSVGLGLGLLLAALPFAVAAQSTSAVVEDFTEEQIGAAPTSFNSPIGWWSIGTNGVDTKPVLFEDGTRYSATTGQNDLAAQAQAQAQGLGIHQLSDSAQGLAYYPVAVFNKVPNFTQGTVVTRFAIVGGDLDNEAGIIFNYQPNGDFLALRMDADESQLELYSQIQGQSAALSIIENVPAELSRWHDLQLTVAPGGTHLTGSLDGQKFLDVDIDTPVSGQVGTMTKTDSVVVFNSFAVDPNGQ
jgi:hypothetical protein